MWILSILYACVMLVNLKQTDHQIGHLPTSPAYLRKIHGELIY